MASLSVSPHELEPLHADGLGTPAREWLSQLAKRPWAGDVYLAGSSGLTLYIGHRDVRGLDIMCPSNRLVGQDRRDLLGELLELDSDLRVETARDGYLYARGGSGLAIRFFYYPYPLIEAEHEIDGFPVASAMDLGLMKIAALISRGSKRDFADLYLLGRHIPLAVLLERSSDKFGHVRDFPLQALKALADRSLLAGEPMPRLREPLAWADVEGWLDDQTRRLGRAHVGLRSTTDEADAEPSQARPHREDA